MNKDVYLPIFDKKNDQKITKSLGKILQDLDRSMLKKEKISSSFFVKELILKKTETSLLEEKLEVEVFRDLESHVESEEISRKPNNFLDLQNEFRIIHESNTTRETAALFLTDEESVIIPIYAVCGEEYKVESLHPDPNHFKELLTDPKLTTYVRFHSHPHSLLPEFSEADKEGFSRFMRLAEWTAKNILDDTTKSIERQINIFDSVNTFTGLHAWKGYAINCRRSYI